MLEKFILHHDLHKRDIMIDKRTHDGKSTKITQIWYDKSGVVYLRCLANELSIFGVY